MNEEHFKLINEFLNFLVNNAFLTENHKFLEFHQTFGYPGFQKKKKKKKKKTILWWTDF